jgi:Protein of unknown function, DUF417
MNAILNTIISTIALIMRRSGLLTEDPDYHLVRVSMVIMFFFGYQKWWPYEAERLVPFISNGPLIWWLYPCSATRVQAGFSVSPNGGSAACCLRGSGTRGSECSAPQVRPGRSSRPSQSSPSCPRDGIPWPDFRPDALSMRAGVLG